MEGRNLQSERLKLQKFVTGERLSEQEVEDIIKCIDLTEDLEGNVKYEECITKIMAGPN